MSGLSSIFGSSSSNNSDSLPSLSTSTSSASSAEVKRQIQEQIGQELAIANATELVNKITENCYDKCVPNPGSSLSTSEQECTKKCMEKYMHAWNTISRSYIARIQQASARGEL